MKQFIYLLIPMALLSCSNKKEQLSLFSTSKIISIKDGDTLHKNSWTISSKVKLDEFITSKFTGEKKVSFMSDIDTIIFNVTPNNTYDFTILYNKEKAFTRISTDTLKEESISKKEVLDYYYDNENKKSLTDTIPFKLGSDYGIHLQGRINKSDTLDLFFDTGANAVVLTSKLIGNKVNIKLDGKIENNGSDGVHNVATSSSNELEIGDLNWKNVKLLSIDYKNPNFDVVLGWIAFENKIVEIDYDKSLLIIHKSMETVSKEYNKIETKRIGGLLYLKGKIIIDEKITEGWFEHDSGFNGSFSLSQQFASKNNLNGVMEKVGTSISSGSAGIEWKANNYILPKLQLGDFELLEVPISIDEKDPKGIENGDILGNNLLKRFNTIIDLQNFEIYLKPNALFGKKY